MPRFYFWGGSMQCRVGCGACCIAASITSPIPGMPDGKPSGIRCVNLDDLNHCTVWQHPHYPAVCRDFIAKKDVCGGSSDEALQTLYVWEKLTAPENPIKASAYLG